MRTTFPLTLSEESAMPPEEATANNMGDGSGGPTSPAAPSRITEAPTAAVAASEIDFPEDTDAEGGEAGSTGSARPAPNTTPGEHEAQWPMFWGIGVSLAAIASTASMMVAERSGAAFEGTFMLALAFLTCVAAALSDSATRRIPNVLTYPALLIAVAVNMLLVPVLIPLFPQGAAWFGAPAWDQALLGFVGCAAIGVISFMFRGLGGGDVKLIAAIGAMLGFPEVGGVLFNALVFATVIGLANLAFRGDLVRRIQAMSMAMQVNLALRKKALDAYPFGKSEAPFGVALLLGLITAQWMPFWEPLLALLAPGVAPPPGG